MNIATNDPLAASEQLRWTQPVAMRPWPLDPGESAPPSPWQDSASPTESASDPSPGTSLVKLIAQLSRQLRSIEQTFMRALKALAHDVESSSASAQVPDANARASARGPSPYDGLIRRTAQRHELDPALLGAVIRQESGFDAGAQSSAGAIGLMQLMPDTARSLGVKDPYDPAQNVEGGARMLRGLIDRYGGKLDYALAAYNAGSGAVDKYHGVPPFAETRHYVRAILEDYKARALGA